METKQSIFCMSGGVGETSYAKNSSFQREGILKIKPILDECMKRLYSSTLPNCLKVADLGCSSGPNALLVAHNIINIVDMISQNLNQNPPTIQYFLNDLIGNDFNSIFQLLPEFYNRLHKEKGDKFGPLFMNATLGSFYGRVFPSNSINLFHSSFGLHFLSQIPKELIKSDKPLNKRNTCVTSTSPPEVYKIYVEQFQDDFQLFLKSRSEELVAGGALALTFFGRDETAQLFTFWGLLGLTLNGMVSENLIEEAKLDFFNFPVYFPTVEEVRQIIHAEGSFTLQCLETIKLNWDAGLDIDGKNDWFLDENMRGEYIAKHVRAVTEPLLKAEFGEEIMDEIFLSFQKKVVKLMRSEKLEHTCLFLFMIKNASSCQQT